MTKVQFSRAIKAMTNSLISIPDDLWGEIFPAISIRVGELEAYMGIRPAKNEKVHYGEAENHD